MIVRRFVPIFARWLHGVSLSLWLGGLVAVGALVAPIAFRAVRAAPVLANNADAQNALAGGIVGDSLSRLNVVSLVCAILILTANGLLLTLGRLSRPARRWTFACLIVALAGGALTVYLAAVLFPLLHATPRGTAEFDRLHGLDVRLSGLQMALLLLLALLSAARDSASSQA